MHAYQFQSSIQSGDKSPWNGPASVVSGNAKTILVVDDEPQIVDLLTSLLEDEGYRVRCACDGREAMGVIQNETPELVISDVMMPSVSGLDLVRHLEGCDYDPSPKVILLSALSKPSTAPGVAFLQKPFDVDDLLMLIDGALDNEDEPAR